VNVTEGMRMLARGVAHKYIHSDPRSRAVPFSSEAMIDAVLDAVVGGLPEMDRPNTVTEDMVRRANEFMYNEPFTRQLLECALGIERRVPPAKGGAK
jgi:hypothetical protein